MKWVSLTVGSKFNRVGMISNLHRNAREGFQALPINFEWFDFDFEWQPRVKNEFERLQIWFSVAQKSKVEVRFTDHEIWILNFADNFVSSSIMINVWMNTEYQKLTSQQSFLSCPHYSSLPSAALCYCYDERDVRKPSLRWKNEYLGNRVQSFNYRWSEGKILIFTWI